MSDIMREKRKLEASIRNMRAGVRKCMNKALFEGDKNKNVEEFHRLQNEIKNARKRLSEINKTI